MAQQRVGGSFAPPLDDQKLAAYRALIDAVPVSPARDALDALHKCCAAWWDLPESTGTGTRPHASGRGTIVDLAEPAKKTLWDLIPWTHELLAMGGRTDEKGTYHPGLFDALESELRNAAFHLLWHVRELDLDREPLTADKLT